MNIKIIAIGKIKDKYLKEGISEYLIKLNKYADVRIHEVDDAYLTSNPTDFEIEKAKNLECNKALKLVSPNDYLINLDLNQEEMTSEQFATFVRTSLEKGGASITFLIGGSYGLSEEAKKRANTSISLSKMTFLHQMTRLILLEQVYRAFKINNHEIYHK